MEKQGEIRPDITPPEEGEAGEKTAAELEEHTTKRAADSVRDVMMKDMMAKEDSKFLEAVNKCCGGKCQNRNT